MSTPDSTVIAALYPSDGLIEAQQRVAAARWCGKAKVKGRVGVGRRQRLHALQFLEAALGLLGLGGLVAKASHEVIDFGDASLLFIVVGLLAWRGARRAAARSRSNCPYR